MKHRIQIFILNQILLLISHLRHSVKVGVPNNILVWLLIYTEINIAINHPIYIVLVKSSILSDRLLEMNVSMQVLWITMVVFCLQHDVYTPSFPSNSIRVVPGCCWHACRSQLRTKQKWKHKVDTPHHNILKNETVDVANKYVMMCNTFCSY